MQNGYLFRGTASLAVRLLNVMTHRTGPKVAGLFAGIGGIERGLHDAGFDTTLLCEIEPAAQAVLRAQFKDVELKADVARLKSVDGAEILTAGFPCQDLSQAGQTAGIAGRQSGLVEHVFRLLGSKTAPRWLLLENVSFMLQLDRGRAMLYLTERLESLGFEWAYRVVDTRAFGLPQRRQRVLLLASRKEDPRPVLFANEAGERHFERGASTACGFYWTEGTKGLGWAIDAVPTLKGGSTIGIPSPPAIWRPDNRMIVTPEIRDTERLQGFPEDWTEPAQHVAGLRPSVRWKLVGNAVSVPVARWVGSNLLAPGEYNGEGEKTVAAGDVWPKAAWGRKGKVFSVDRSMWPVRRPYHHLADFLKFECRPLSEKATAGFLSRARGSSLRFVDGFLDDVEYHLHRMRAGAAVA
jgi:DNA (cytosine-5)-methyltransferase 1